MCKCNERLELARLSRLPLAVTPLGSQIDRGRTCVRGSRAARQISLGRVERCTVLPRTVRTSSAQGLAESCVTVRAQVANGKDVASTAERRAARSAARDKQVAG